MLSSTLYNFSSMNYKNHLLFALLVRIVFISYGSYQDNISSVSYTDIDYKVFTDASRHILNGESPYTRHTYRYTPLLALLLTPNIFVHHTFGKLLFCIFDLLVAVLLRSIVRNNLCEYEYMKKTDMTDVKSLEEHKIKFNTMLKNPKFKFKINICMLLWLYNPMSITISTRGNCDAIATFLVILTLYFLQNKKMYFISGLIHGLSVHVRLYPLIYSLAIYIFLSNYSFYSVMCSNPFKKIPILNRSTGSKLSIKQYLYIFVPNLKQTKFIIGFILSLSTLIGISYYFYGYKFLYETYLYHFIRKDVRHNFSIYFYLQYLAASIKYESFWLKLLMFLPQLVLLITFSVKYSLNKFCLNFSFLTQTIVFVIYNSVLTSQYFVWVMGILPLCIWQIKMPLKTAISLLFVWIIAQVMWLLPAYYLEFKGQNTFFFIWIQCISFYCANVAILGRLIKYFMSEI